MDALCAGQAPDRLAAAQNTFLTVVAAWSEAELIRFGPVTQENRLERILFWPDRKGTGLKQVQAALAEKDASAADPATLKDKSVAMQGLGALEFVLFGTGSEALNEPGDGYRCAYGRAVAANIDDMAAQVLAGWQDPAGIARQWSNPAPDNPLYRNDQEAMVELIGIVVHGLEMTRDVRIDGFLGKAPTDDKPKQAVLWRSGGTLISIRGNLLGLRKLFDASGLATLLSEEDAWIVQSITFEFTSWERILDVAAGPIQEALGDSNKRQALVVARLITSHLSELFGVTLAGELGISAGFSSLDGD
jgi:predicted lipoprotein